jgi:general secretion pathway protein G
MYLKQRNAFTMLELVFVVVIIGILSAVAIPRFAMNRDDAIITKAKTTVAAVRSAIAMERQKRILQGDFTKIAKLSSSEILGKDIFDGFGGKIANPVLGYPLLSCKDRSATGCWFVKTHGAGTTANPTIYIYKMPSTGNEVDFRLINNRFNCKTPSDSNCKRLTR